MRKNKITRKACAYTAVASVLSLSIMATGCKGPVPSSKEAIDLEMRTKSTKLSVAGKANIVYIVLDDMGYSDLGCYGSNISTPNIDRLARQGIIYSDYCTQPMSSPSRAALLTGSDPNSMGMGVIAEVSFGQDTPNVNGVMRPDFGTLPQHLLPHGYDTFAVGKWHLGRYNEFTPDGDKQHWPSGKGFTQNWVFPGSQMNQMQPGAMITGDKYTPVTVNTADYHFTNNMVNKSLEFIDATKSKNTNTPFFLYFALGAMHGPFNVPESYARKYVGKYNHGWDAEREIRLKKQIELGLLPAGTRLPPRNEGIPAWNELSPVQKKVAERHMEVYAGYLEHTDEQIGRFLNELKARGEYENTIFVLVSDNGANANGNINGSDNAHHNENLFISSVEEQEKLSDKFGDAYHGTQYNSGWAMASNTPFRYNKTSSFNGGTRVPLIITWVKGIANPGRVNHELVSSTDIMPTVLDALGYKPLKVVNNVKQFPMAGSSIAATFASNDPLNRKKIVSLLMGNSFNFGDGEYMICNSPVTSKVELFDMKKDPTQIKDLAAEQPKKVKELLTKYEDLKEARNSQNFIQDLLNGMASKPVILIQRYGFTGLKAMWSLKSGKPTKDPVAARWVAAMKAFLYVPGKVGYKGVGVVLHKAPDVPFAKRDYSYDPKLGPFFAQATGPIGAVSHSVSTTVTTTEKPNGVIVACGGIDGGYAIYVKGGKLVYEYNFGNEHIKLIATKSMPAGKVDIRYDYAKKDLFTGIGSLRMNGEVVAEGPQKDLPMLISYDYMSFGADVGSKVSLDYADDFPFNGTVGEVKIHLADDVWNNG